MPGWDAVSGGLTRAMFTVHDNYPNVANGSFLFFFGFLGSRKTANKPHRTQYSQQPLTWTTIVTGLAEDAKFD